VNNSTIHTFDLPVHREALESRVALAFAARLRDGSDTLPHDVSERLRFARERAVAAAALQRKAAVAVAAHGGHGRAAALSGPPSLWWRLASALPLVVLLAGLVLIEQHHSVEQINVAAEIDSALLADELPPDAYRDPGFAEYLRSSAAP
jgi:hypothetical protein